MQKKYPPYAEAVVKKYVQHPAPFSRATPPLLIVCLYLAYCKLLELTAVSNAGMYEKLAILDECSGWSLLDGQSHVITSLDSLLQLIAGAPTTVYAQ